MSFRSRALIAAIAAALVPLMLLAFGVRRQLSDRLEHQYRASVAAYVTLARDDLARESDRVERQLRTISQMLAEDDAFRIAVVQGRADGRGYVLDYAVRAMHVTGLSMLQIQDELGRIVSSGHFRNEFDRLEPGLPRLLTTVPAEGVLVRARAPTGSFVSLVRVDSVRISMRRFHLVGGIAVDDAFLSRFARAEGLEVSVELPDSTSVTIAPPPRAGFVVDTVPLPFADLGDGGRIAEARLIISQPLTALEALQRDLSAWFIAALAAIAIGSLVLAIWMAARLSRPLAELAQAAERIDLSGTGITIATDRSDEVGSLARRLAALARRLRTSATELRDAERRATVGDMARQVNHDVKNGLIPIRNVLRHLGEVHAEQPAELPSAFAARKATLDSSVAYLENLARNYARLTPRQEHARIDVNAVVRDVVAASGAQVETRLAAVLPEVSGDPVALRRIVDNLVRNAVESLDDNGRVVVATARSHDDNVVINVADNGRGMTPDELSRAFDDFFTTKIDGTGLGLSVVRRLVNDLQGSVHIESVPGEGTTVSVQVPGTQQPVP